MAYRRPSTASGHAPPNTLARRAFILGGTAAASAVAFKDLESMASPHLLASADWTVSRIGAPIHNVAANSAAFGTWPDGRESVYLALNGSPAKLAAVDVQTNELLDEVRLPGASGAWGTVTAPTGVVYVGSWSNGHLYRYEPGAGVAEDLGRPISSERYLWRLDVDDAGRVYGGTWPNGAVFRYDPASGEFVDYGRVAPDSDYARSVAVGDGTVFVGLGTRRARLFAIDAESGSKTEISLPGGFENHSTVYSLEVRRDRLFAWVTSPENHLLVFDTQTHEFVEDLGLALGIVTVSPVGEENALYYVDGDRRLASYDMRTRTVDATPVVDSFTARQFGWVHRTGSAIDGSGPPDYPGNTLAMVDFLARLWFYNPRTQAHERVDTPVEGEPASLQSIGIGPDQKIYTSGYQSGGLAAYDPTSGGLHQFPRGTVNQVEGMHAHGGRLYLGVYAGAELLAFDPSQPFDYGTNPTIIGTLKDHDQDRPFAWTSAGAVVVTGTVPSYGKLGGALTVIDPATDDCLVYRDVIADQSVTALAGLGPVVAAGTSVWGGLGIEPTQTDAVLFLWDVGTGEKVWEGVPIPGERAITDLAVTPDGHVWGITAGKVFEFDPDTRQVLRVVTLAPFDWSKVGHLWISGQVEVRENGELLVLARGGLQTLDTTTETATAVASDVKRFVLAADGSIFFTRANDLCRLDPPA